MFTSEVEQSDYAPVAQWIEREPAEFEVTGSNSVRRAPGWGAGAWLNGAVSPDKKPFGRILTGPPKYVLYSRTFWRKNLEEWLSG